MSPAPPPADGARPIRLDEIGHPKGTLAILAIYMLLFVLGWAGLYFAAFLPRGTPDAQVTTHAEGGHGGTGHGAAPETPAAPAAGAEDSGGAP